MPSLYTQASKAACQWVLQELVRPGDVIHLAHCVPSFPSQGLYTLPDGRIAVVDFKKLLHNEKEYLKAAERVVAEWAWKVFNPAKIPFVIDVIKEQEAIAGDKGGIARELCKKASEVGAAALVLTPHGRGGLGEIVMGSVAADCTRYSETAVVVLHELPDAHSGKLSTSTGGVTSWLGDVIKQLTHPDTVGTAAEVIVESVASGPLHPGKQKQKHLTPGIVSTSDFPSDDENLLGQTIGEIPGTEASLPGIDQQDEKLSSGNESKKGISSTTGRTIVIPVDDSAASERACEWAAREMWRPGDILHLLHVIPSLPSVAYGSGPMAGLSSSFLYVLEPPTAAFKEATMEYMERRFHGMLRKAGVEFESDVLLEMTDGGVQNVGYALLTRADEVDAAAIVVGSHGRGGIGELLLGSVAQWLGHHSERPVVILH